ncbi:MAG TPA: condensation domain-containing protein, partial [Lentzea sp.]
VQLRGFRIELGEVEAVVREVAGVVDVAVTVADSADHLVAHVVGTLPADIMSVLAAKLPQHMVPQRFIPLDELPITVNGKLDRAVLEARAREDAAPVVTADAPVLDALVEIFRDALPVSDVDADTDYFVAGGDSIVAIGVVNRARALGLTFSPRDMFLHKTPRALAEKFGAQPVVQQVAEEISDGPVAPTPIVLRLRELGGSLDLFAQARQLECASLEDARRAANAVVATHPALRLRLNTDHGVWSLRTEPATEVDVVVSAFDPQEAAEAAAGRLDAEAGVMAAFTWLEHSQTLVVAVHHFAVDAVSWMILLEDLAVAMRGEELAPVTTSFASYAAALTLNAQSGGDLRRWIETLDAPVLTPQLGERREVTVTLAADITGRVVQKAPNALGVGLTELLLGALRTALTEIQSTPTDLVIDLERHGRVPAAEHHDYTRTVGWFTAVAPVKLSPATDPVAAAREVVVRQPDEVAHVGFGQLRHLNPQTAPVLAALPRPQVLFNYLGRASESQALHVDPENRPSPYAVEVNCWVDAAGSLRATFGLTEDVSDEIGARWLLALERIADASATVRHTAPVSPLQRGLYFQAELAGRSGQYVAQSFFTFDRRLDPDALGKALAHVIAKHPVVGAGFESDENGMPVQVLGTSAQVPVRTVDVLNEDAVEALR